MKFAAFLFATISAAARLQQTSEESHDSLDQVVRPPRLEDLQTEQTEASWSLGDDVNGSTIQEELVKFLDKDQQKAGHKKEAPEANKKWSYYLSKVRKLFRSKKEKDPQKAHHKKEKVPIFKEPDRRAVTFLESAMKGDAKAQEHCQQQLGGLMKSLLKACKKAKPRSNFLGGGSILLPPKNCNESVKDLFLHGQDLLKVETSQVPQHEKLPLLQSLRFLEQWLVKLAKLPTAKNEPVLWAGFWTDPDAEHGHLHRASKETLQRFSRLTETNTIHPSTKLGRMIEQFNELDQCKGELAWKLTGNFWSFASYSFVLGMKRKKQGTVIALVNKDLEGPRSLSKSVLFQHEVPTLGIAAWGLGFWSPQVILIDLKATCNKTSSMLRERLFARLSSYFHVKAHRNSFTSTEFALRSRPLWQCLDCEEGKCELGSELATHLRTLRQARKRERNLNQELCNAVHPTYRNWNYWRTNQPPRSVQQLLELNADPSRVFCQGFAEGDDTPLHIAVRGCQADTVRQLLASGTPTEAKNGGDHTPLMLVAHFCNSPEGADIAEQLLQHGANASAFSYDDLVHSTTALHEFTRPNVTFHQIVDKFHRTRPNTAVAEVLKKHLAE